MLAVYHHPICPFSRKLRIVLREKQLPFELFTVNFWERPLNLLKLNPAGTTPIIVQTDKSVIYGNQAIFEYLEETALPRLMLDSSVKRAQVRQLCEWFDYKFYQEVTRYLINERYIKAIHTQASPDASALRAAKKNLINHLNYLNFILQEQHYLCGDEPTLADFAAASQLSCLDFLGDIDWHGLETIKNWYALVKSRPSFRSILMDVVTGIKPPAHYANLDF
jgi:glutathione S-transferase